MSELNKRELDLLERCFTAEIEDRLPCQFRSKLSDGLCERGFMQAIEMHLGGKGLPVIIKGYALTPKGHMAYCTSERCTNAEEPSNA